jgi:lysophospholipase L1-like esterase
MKGQRVTAIHALLALTTPVIGLTIPSTRNTPSLDPRNAQSDGATFVYDPIRITKGYVAFGDSYAAGIGTGMTDTGGCRQGQFSYPKQLAKMATDAIGKEIDFQNYPCSGAVVSEVLEGGAKSQIDQWKNPKNADIATISIGGNDVGFYSVLTACVLRVGQAWAGDCDEAVKKAADIINGRDLSNDVNSALNQILAKSGRDDFKIYLTGYPTFFNDQTDYCDCEYTYLSSEHSEHH